MHTTKVVIDDKTITMTIFLPNAFFLLLGTSTPRGFMALPSLSVPGFGRSLIVAVAVVNEGGEGGRPAKLTKHENPSG